MLTQYQQNARRILNDQGFARFFEGDLTDWINQGRGQIAGEAECVRVYASLSVGAASRQYPFSAISFPDGTQGVAGVINVRMVTYTTPGTALVNTVTPREWEWFNTYVLPAVPNIDANGNPVGSVPETWAQFGQGANGTIFVNLLDTDYTLNLDAVCYPVPLVDDDTAEAIPYLWTDAVPYYAAYLAFLTAQDADKAEAMFKLYTLFAQRARQFANPSTLTHQYEQSADPMMASRLGLVKAVA